jgi:3-(3-hydroxy-phenyl)propionate hydroxylase
MTEHAVVIAGGGPTGLMLAAELALARVDAAIVERRPSQQLAGLRAGGLHARTLEVLDQRGIAERFVRAGQVHKAVHFYVPLDMSDFPSRYNHVLALRQNHIERILADWVGELGVPILRAREVTGFAQDDAGVDVELADGERLRAQYLVGCDGGRSLIRKRAAIEFAGWDATTSWLIAEVSVCKEPAWGFKRDAVGTHAIGKLDDGPRRAGIVLTERSVASTGEPTLADVSTALIAAYGTDYGIHSPTWISRFTDMARQAAAYRERRVLLAGDAAHVHAPVGGQGLNTGVQDAVNLGWKLAQVVRQTSPASLLDTYHAERHPVAARVLRNTMAQVALRRPDDHSRALADSVSELLRMDEPRRRWAAEISGLDICYHAGDGHALVGRRMPDLDLVTAHGPVRVNTLLHDARPLLINLGAPGSIDVVAWADRVRCLDAQCAGPWQLPVIGEVPAPSAVLIRPDGYVAWVRDDAERSGLEESLTTWFGAPDRSSGAKRSA